MISINLPNETGGLHKSKGEHTYIISSIIINLKLCPSYAFSTVYHPFMMQAFNFTSVPMNAKFASYVSQEHFSQ